MISRGSIVSFPSVRHPSLSRHHPLLTPLKVIHPDKAKHPKAPEAFDILKKAEGELSDEKRRDDLDATIRQARIVVLKSLSLPTNTPDNDPALTSLNPSFSARLRAQAKEMLIDEEVRRRKYVCSFYLLRALC